MCNIEWLWKGQTAFKGQTSNKKSSKYQSTKLEIKLFCEKFCKVKSYLILTCYFFISEQIRCTALLYDNKSGQHFYCPYRQVVWVCNDEVKGVLTMSYLYQVRKLFRLIEVVYNVD